MKNDSCIKQVKNDHNALVTLIEGKCMLEAALVMQNLHKEKARNTKATQNFTPPFTSNTSSLTQFAQQGNIRAISNEKDF